MASTVGDLVTAIEGEIITVLPTWKKLAYIIEVEKNSFRTQTDRYGVRALGATEIDGVTKYLTFEQAFEVVLTKGYIQSNIDDTEQEDAGLELRAAMLDLYLQFIKTKAGLPSVVMNITDLSMGAMEYLEEDKVAVLRSTMNITYRLSLI